MGLARFWGAWRGVHIGLCGAETVHGIRVFLAKDVNIGAITGVGPSTLIVGAAIILQTLVSEGPKYHMAITGYPEQGFAQILLISTYWIVLHLGGIICTRWYTGASQIRLEIDRIKKAWSQHFVVIDTCQGVNWYSTRCSSGTSTQACISCFNRCWSCLHCKRRCRRVQVPRLWEIWVMHIAWGG